MNPPLGQTNCDVGSAATGALTGFAFDGYHRVAAPAVAVAAVPMSYTFSSDIDNENRPNQGNSGLQFPGCDHFVDSDNDGIPDWFEWLAIRYLPNDNVKTLADVTGASDLDGDELSLLDELMYGGRGDLYDSGDSDNDGLTDINERMLDKRSSVR